jgi:hypothetical protein
MGNVQAVVQKNLDPALKIQKQAESESRHIKYAGSPRRVSSFDKYN